MIIHMITLIHFMKEIPFSLDLTLYNQSKYLYLNDFKNWTDESDIFTTLNYKDSTNVTISNSNLNLNKTNLINLDRCFCNFTGKW